MIQKHNLWLKSLGKEGIQLNLCEENLSNEDFSSCDLSEAGLIGINFDRAILNKVNFNYGNLAHSSFKKANYTDFEMATISNSNTFRSTFIG